MPILFTYGDMPYKACKNFNNTALIKEINDISNLVALCPTHHWELDNNIFTL